MDTRGRRTLRVVLLALGLAVTALLVWVVGIVGIGQFGEDICLNDPPVDAAGYQTEASVLPPRVTCVYNTVDGGTLEVGHPAYAYVATLWLIAFPLTALAGIVTLTAAMMRREATGPTTAMLTPD